MAKKIRFFTRCCNILEIFGIFLMLCMAFLFQFIFHEIPCPLCILQRLGFLGIAFGLLLNLRFGLRPSHYAIALFSALFTSFVSLRQIALHVVPGTGAYGDPFLGWHLYTWVFIVSMLVIIFTTFVLSFDRQYLHDENHHSRGFRIFTDILFFLITALVIANIIAVFFECGFGLCPENPVEYNELLKLESL